MLQETVSAYRREISALQDRNHKMSTMAQRHEHIIHTMSQDLRQATEKLALEEVWREKDKELGLGRKTDGRMSTSYKPRDNYPLFSVFRQFLSKPAAIIPKKSNSQSPGGANLSLLTVSSLLSLLSILQSSINHCFLYLFPPPLAVL